jgi:uncharacterized membrane protein YecN with MAPEG domain
MQLRSFKNTTRGLWVGRGLVGIGIVAMCVCVYFNARHGWNLGTILPDQVALATMHGLVDIATALLVSGGAILFAWYMRKMGFAACFFALLLTCFSILSVSGFMSGRMAALQAQKTTLEILDKQGRWTGGSTYKEAGRSERRSLRAEMRDNVKEMVRVASLIPDSHAMAIASMTGQSVEFVQRALILVSSGMAQALKYICLLVGFFLLSNRDERGAGVNHQTQAGSASGSGGPPGGEPRKPTLVHTEPPKPAAIRTMQGGSPNRWGVNHGEPTKVSGPGSRVLPGLPQPTSAFDKAYDAINANPRASSRQVAKKAGVSQSTAQRVLKRQRGKADITVRKYGNGGGYHPACN